MYGMGFACLLTYLLGGGGGCSVVVNWNWNWNCVKTCLARVIFCDAWVLFGVVINRAMCMCMWRSIPRAVVYMYMCGPMHPCGVFIKKQSQSRLSSLNLPKSNAVIWLVTARRYKKGQNNPLHRND